MTNHSPDFTDLISYVVRAFERMRVPPGPTAQETTELMERVASGHGKTTTAADRDAVAEPVMVRNEDDSDIVSRWSRRAGGWNKLTRKLRELTNPQRTAVAGALLSTIVGLTLLLLALNSGQRLSAMERMGKQLREVKSYGYKESWRTTWVAEGKKLTTTWRGDGQTYWRAPDAFRSGQKIVKTEEASAQRTEQVLEDFVEIFPAGKLGIFIDHTMKTYRRLPFDPVGSVTYPSDLLRMIRENSGEVTRDLGTKKIQGRKARGYMIALKDAHEVRVTDPVEVWVDPETDLPLEFGYEGKNETTFERRITDCRWNIELAPGLFEATPPEGYADVTPPSREQEIAQIVFALKLYAELSGGHYPRVTGCDGIALRDEMLKMAGYSREPRADWNREEKFQRIERATVGLDWIARIVRNRNHAGYYPQTVGPHDKDKVLLWWRVFAPVRYRVVCGDLRTEIVSEARWAELVPEAETAGWPAGEQKPKDNR